MKEKIITVVLCLMLIAAIGISCRADVRTERAEYIVKPGDTLWDISVKYAPKGMDVRDHYKDTSKHNGLKNYTIYPGMVLEIVREVK